MRAALVAVLLVSCATAPVSAPVKKTTREVIAASLPAVVLLLNRHQDGKLGYGSGLVVGDGVVLTNLHVVQEPKELFAMLYREGRTTYAATDGGLARFLFENQSELVAAKVLKSDPKLDLAVVKLEAATPHRLAFRAEPAQLGEPVLALGHPKENVWSFSAGLVSAVHEGQIQTDAAINTGNSGGPLLDAEGEVLGINTSRLFADAQGVAYARPIQMGRYLLGEAAAPVSVDLSAPDKAVLSCFHALELDSPAYVDCVDLDAWYERYTWAFEQAEKQLKLSAAECKQTEARFDMHDPVKSKAKRRRNLLWFLSGELQKNLHADDSHSAEEDAKAKQRFSQAELAKLVDQAVESVRRSYESEPDVARVEKENGIKIDRPDFFRESLKNGFRAEATQIDADHAWVQVTGRNFDDSQFRVSYFLTRRANGWVLQDGPGADALKSLPKAYAPPPWTAEEAAPRFIAELVAHIAGRERDLPWHHVEGEAKKP